MPLTEGNQLGPYEILAPIGAGGMGEVYKAQDTRLDRIVAIKVLPSHLADNPDLKQRFEREARAVSSLNHPHICTLHDIGEQDGTDFLVMEYIEGETLADRLKKGALPLDQALRYAIEIADALDKAHRQGVVHRDLKPGNIMLTKAGAKLLDFGLAKLKASGSERGASVLSALPTKEKPLTEKGSILGTFQYMAPEQLEGKEADGRTDIFAFGAVLYEMLTGKRAFEGKSQASLIGAIMNTDPPAISVHQPLTPAAVDHVVRTCLAKDPDERWQTAGDVERQLKWIAEGGSETGIEGLAAARPGRRVRLAWGLSILMAVLVTGLTVWSMMRPRPRPPRPMTRFAVTLPETTRLVHGGIALSAEGRHLLYFAEHDGVRQLYRRPLDQFEAVPIRGTESAQYPFFSPDGQWVGFFADAKLKKVSLVGGPPVTLCDAAGFIHGASWGLDNVIVFGVTGAPGLMQVPASGGNPEPVTTVDSEERWHGWPDILPGGKAVLFTAWSGGIDNARIAVQSLETGERRNLVDGTDPRYVPTGHILFARPGSLWAVPFDANRLEVTGSPTPVLEGVLIWEGVASFALAGDGSLVYVLGTASTLKSKLVWVDRRGAERALTAPLRVYRDPRLSPDGERLAVTIDDATGRGVWVLELSRGTLTRLTFEGGNSRPIWSPDGERIIFSSNRVGDTFSNIFSKPADASGTAEQLTTGAHRIPTSASSDGKTIVFRQGSATTNRDIGMVRLEGEREPEMLLQTPSDEHTGMLSPDDRWLAYVSNESGRQEIYVRPFPGPGGKWPISTEGGTEPMWSRDGQELFYRNGEKMMAVAISTEPEFAPAKPTSLFEGVYETGGGPAGGYPGSNYDLTPDGRFVMIRTDESSGPTQINVVLNWFEELKRLVPTEN